MELDDSCMHDKAIASAKPLTARALVPVCRHGRRSRSWCQQLLNRPLHCPVHLGYNCGHISFVDCPDFRNSVGPHCLSSSEAQHLSGDCNFDFDAAFVVNFFELLQAAAKNVIDV